jgi:hypothetical protein
MTVIHAFGGKIVNAMKQLHSWRGFGLVVEVLVWYISDPGPILIRDGRYTFGCIPQGFEYTLAYTKTLIF